MEEDLSDLKGLILKHKNYTESPVADNILKNWENASKKFVKVMPTDYKRVLNEMKIKRQNNG